ncbi:hypothetical protein BDP81DRAFT_467792 [Colletotrichum phormii]|uniref:Rhodopsin domain-containing protein n=1 Tax=Colletotrichum phormii TaxID=359342 RepID=A0AAJ0A0I3_9PEZI|nr:uncharacterized protein BDP81DRAFT_467792 [Colletotrichum phormii]KAK1654156.1 hypothetical protein BDP81DRAFT_467792 [Colletotrichum phormii]
MSVMVVVAILALIFVFANCTPLAATWNPAFRKWLDSSKWKIRMRVISIPYKTGNRLVESGIGIVSKEDQLADCQLYRLCDSDVDGLDVCYYPFFIVAGLQLSRRKKVSVIAILGLGIFASIATCIRMPYLKYYDAAKYLTEIVYHLGVISITSNLECSLGIIGSSLPPLQKLFKFYYGSSHDGNYKITGE